MTEFTGDLSKDPIREDGKTYRKAPCVGCKYLRESEGAAGFVKHFMTCGWWDTMAPVFGPRNPSIASTCIPRVRVEGPFNDDQPTACPQYQEK